MIPFVTMCAGCESTTSHDSRHTIDSAARRKAFDVIRLLVPLAAVGVFFLCAWVTVRFYRPREPRRFFLAYALLLLVATALVIARLWPLAQIEDVLALTASLFLQLLACLTMWNAFYSLLWGFSGSLMHDLVNDATLRHRERLIRSYE